MTTQVAHRYGRDDSVRLRELLTACKEELPGNDVPHICRGAQRILSMVRSIESELGRPSFDDRQSQSADAISSRPALGGRP